MVKKKVNIGHWQGLALCAIVLLMCLVLAVGPTWGRYRSVLDPFEYLFSVQQSSQVYLWGEKTDSGYETLPSCWTVNEDGAQMPLTITNGTAKKYSQKDMCVSLRIAVTEGVEAEDNLLFALQLKDQTTYTAVAKAIAPNTKQYNEFGPGWLYLFYDESGSELTWLLEGGALSELEAVLTCVGETLPNSSMVQLQVAAVGVD